MGALVKVNFSLLIGNTKNLILFLLFFFWLIKEI
jgi:hypothetical protein